MGASKETGKACPQPKLAVCLILYKANNTVARIAFGGCRRSCGGHRQGWPQPIARQFSRLDHHNTFTVQAQGDQIRPGRNVAQQPLSGEAVDSVAIAFQ